MKAPPDALPSDLKRNVLDAIAKTTPPELWAKCYPRIYQETGGSYESPRVVAADMVGAAAKVEQGYFGENEQADLIWASKLAQYRVPLFWVSQPLAEALKRTTPPQSLDIRTMKFPFDAAVFMLPRDTLLHDTDEGEAAFVSYVRTRLGDPIRSLARTGPEFMHPKGNGVVMIFAHTTAEHLLHWTIPDYIPLDLGHLDSLIQKFEDGVWRMHKSDFINYDMSDADNRFMARVVHFVLGTLVLMLARPELVKTGELQKRVIKRGETPREYWSPSRIGEHYKLRRISEPQGGTHASPRGHWVRGFYREQPYGEKHSLRREMWIEPYWRGGDD